jgi:two-component system NarL family sensor kinase
MADVATRAVAAGRPRAAPLGRSVTLTFAAMVLVACVVAAVLLLARAQSEREAIREQALTAAVALSFRFDQEVAAANSLLKGLSSSPALKAGDVRTFYDQLIATPIPEGSWLILQDMEGQLANTLRPFGSALPRHRDFPTYPEALNRVRDRGWTVSGRMSSLAKPGETIVVLSLRLDHPDGTMKGFITTVLPQGRLAAILEDAKLPPGWTVGLFDRKQQPIVTARDQEKSLQLPMPSALQERLATGDQSRTLSGFVQAIDEREIPILAAYQSSGSTNWTTVVAVPLALLDAPVNGILWQMVGPAAFLLIAGLLAALFTARQFALPIKALSREVTDAKSEVSQLSDQLLALQEEERQRIARELHDSTTQYLVAANLALGRLEPMLRQTPSGVKTCQEIEDLLNRALLELRVFTYLLHPPNLAEDGLGKALEEFVDGFGRRTGLRAQIRVSDRLDDVALDIQRSILRVAQEALANVHRHAGASHVYVGTRIAAGCLVLRISDNGQGMSLPDSSERRVRFGVGIPGMNARLQQFGGDLKIRTGSKGTSLLAYVPLNGPSELGTARLTRRLTDGFRFLRADA